MDRRQFIKGMALGTGMVLLGVDFASGKDESQVIEVSQGYESDVIPWGANSALDAVYRLPEETDDALRQRVISKFNIRTLM